MWRGRDGRVHTVALPDPGDLFTEAARRAVQRVLEGVEGEDRDVLTERMELGVIDYWSARPVDETEESAFIAAAPPAQLFNSLVANTDELEDALRAVDPRWALDVIVAVDDL